MCAREKRQGKMSTFTFPASSRAPRPSWWTNTSYPWETTANAWIATVGSMFDIEVYGSNFFQIDSRLISAKQAAEGESATKADVAFFPAARKWARNLKEAMQRTSVPSPYARKRHWMLLSPEDFEMYGIGDYRPLGLQDHDEPVWDFDRKIFRCRLCRKCSQAISQAVPKVPPYALCNGMWGGPQPDAMAELTFVEKMIIQRARLYIMCKRVTAESTHVSAPRTARQRHGGKNAIAYPQQPERLLQQIGLLPSELTDVLHVQFAGCDRGIVGKDVALRVSVHRLRTAYKWLSENCWEYLPFQEEGVLVQEVEDLLRSWEEETGHVPDTVPRSVIESASAISEADLRLKSEGPADATVESADESFKEQASQSPAAVASAHESSKEQSFHSRGGERNNAFGDYGFAAVVETGENWDGPIRLWYSAMRKLKVIQDCEAKMSKNADCCGDEHAEEHTRAVLDAVRCIQKLKDKEVLDTLKRFSEEREVHAVPYYHATKPLSFFHEEFWQSCFIDLFCRGDCRDRDPQQEMVQGAAEQDGYTQVAIATRIYSLLF